MVRAPWENYVANAVTNATSLWTRRDSECFSQRNGCLADLLSGSHIGVNRVRMNASLRVNDDSKVA